MTTGFFDAFKNFLNQSKMSAEENKVLLPDLLQHKSSNGICCVSTSQTTSYVKWTRPDTQSTPGNCQTVEALKSGGSLSSCSSFVTAPGKVNSECISVVNDCPIFSVPLDKISDKSSLYIGSNVEVEQELGEPLIASPYVCCDEDHQNSHEAIFIPLQPTDDYFIGPYAKNFKGHLESEFGKLPVQSHSIRRKPNLVKRYNKFIKDHNVKICHKAKRGRSRAGGRDQGRRRVKINKPKVIVEKSPTVGICLSDISALKDSECESDMEHSSDIGNNNNHNNTHIVSSESFPDVSKTGTIDNHNGHASEFHLPVSTAKNNTTEEVGVSKGSLSTDSVVHQTPSFITKENQVWLGKPKIKKNCTPHTYSNKTNSSIIEPINKFRTKVLENSHNESNNKSNLNDNIELNTSSNSTKNLSDCITSSTSTELCYGKLPVSIKIENVNLPGSCHIAAKSTVQKKKSNQYASVPKKVRKTPSQLPFHTKQEKAVKLGDIEHLAKSIEELPVKTISVLHNLLFDISAPSSTDPRVAEAKENILSFNGFPFSASTKCCAFALKRIRLKRLQGHVLRNIAYFLFGEGNFKRKEMEEKILSFLMCPTRRGAEEIQLKKKQRKMLEEALLKEKILQNKGPKLTVMLQKLSDKEIQKYNSEVPKKHEVCMTSVPNNYVNSIDSATTLERNNHYPAYLSNLIENSSKANSTSRSETDNLVNSGKTEAKNMPTDKIAAVVPAVRQSYIVKGPGKMLKSFPDIASKVNVAEKRTIHLLHVLLFGLPDEFEKSKSNILEFSGFPESQKLLQKRRGFLKLMPPSELEKICRMLNLYYDMTNRCQCIDLLLDFLEEPSEKLMKSNSELFSALLCDKPHGKPLRSFDEIRFNIECATPDDLTELHDVIFLKPCDSFEIHQRVLDFSGFSFDINSFDYQCRKTLMCYMSFASIQKISKLLGLMPVHPRTHKEDLTTCILKFLMDPKVPVCDGCGNSPNKKAHIVMLRTANDGKQCAFIQQSHSQCSSSAVSKLFPPQNGCCAIGLKPISFPVNHNHSNTVDLCLQNSEKGVIGYDKQNGSLHSDEGYLKQSTSTSEDFQSSSDDEVDSSFPLSAFVSHPCDSQLKNDIQEVIQSNLNALTMNDLVDKVLSQYPEFDLCYRRKFIKAKARKILSRIRKLPLQQKYCGDSSSPHSVPHITFNEPHASSQHSTYQPSETEERLSPSSCVQ